MSDERVTTSDEPKVGDRVDTPNGRHYKTPRGVFPSVTTILGKSKSWKDIQGLKAWREKEGAAVADKITKDAAGRGTKIHSMIEGYFNDFEDGEGLWWDSLAPVLKHITRPVFLEEFTWHDIGFGGTVDFLGYYKGKLAVIDWKTARTQKRLEWILDYILQSTAYACAVRQRYPEFKDKLETIVIVILRTNEREVHEASKKGKTLALKSKKAQVFEISGAAELGAYWRQFRDRMAEYERRHGNKNG